MTLDVTAEYKNELAELPFVYGLNAALPGSDRVRQILAGRHAYMIASGGAAPASVIAADLHTEHAGGTAEVLSPLAFIEKRKKVARSVAVVFSARGRHPDSAMAVSHALHAQMDVVLFTTRPSADLPKPFDQSRVSVVTVPSTRAKDGFLATGSVLSMASSAAVVYGCALPAALEPISVKLAGDSDNIIVLHGVNGRAAALDIQIRHEELGLASVETTDFRNFAHGRHVGLERRSAKTLVLALITPDVKAIAERTLRTIPKHVAVFRLASPARGVVGSLQLLASAMHVPLEAASLQSISPSRPPVPSFGRELYHLPFKRMYPPPVDTPVTRKISAIGAGQAHASARVLESYDSWRRWVRQQDIQTLVLDYDGTCVSTSERFELPRREVRDALVDLLDRGLNLAFASGRGKSLFHDLRVWVPESFHAQVHLGLHNGSWRQPLASPLEFNERELGWVRILEAHLEPYAALGAISIRRAASQIGVEPRGRAMTIEAAQSIVATAAQELGLPVQVVASGHSVDVLSLDSGKAKFLTDMQSKLGTALAIGDQGAPGGNDFALLSATRASVSVDACSPALDRCWQIGRAGRRGPDALLDVVGMLHTDGRRTRLIAQAVKDGSDEREQII